MNDIPDDDFGHTGRDPRLPHPPVTGDVAKRLLEMIGVSPVKLSDLAGPDAAGWSDVAVFVRADGSESEPFVLGEPLPMGRFRIEYANRWDTIGGSYPVRRLGRGRLVPARIEMEGEATTGPRVPQCDCSARCRSECACECDNWPEDEVQRLANWKESQLAVESEWDVQAVGRLLNVPMGQSIRAAIQPGIESLQERVRVLQKREVFCVWCGLQFESTLQYQAQHPYQHAQECEKHPVRNLEAQVRLLREFARECAMNFDCDNDAHRYQTFCRQCEARAALAATAQKPTEDAK